MSQNKLYKLVGGIFLLSGALVFLFFYAEIYLATAQTGASVQFTVEPNESVAALAARLEQEQVIKAAWLFRKYLVLQGIDKGIQAGQFTVQSPITLARVAAALQARTTQEERTITIIPGWDLRDVAAYFEQEAIGTEDELFALIGEPARLYDPPQAAVGRSRLAPVFPSEAKIIAQREPTVSYEGYLAPETYRIFSDATLKEVVEKLITQRDREFTEEMYQTIEKSGRTAPEVLTLASIVEREVRGQEDRAKVADIFWRRYDAGWALQADSSVHYAVGRKGDVFTTKKERDTDSLWNTYKYPGLPPSPICNPSLASIRAAIYPEKNEYWYFLTTFEGEVKYARTLEEHNGNVARYLR